MLKLSGSLWRDVFLLVVAVLGFQLGLWGAVKVEAWLGWDAFSVVEVLATAAQVFTASAVVWLFVRLVFPATLGKDFGQVFNAGWESMTAKAKTDRILLVFLVLFFALAHKGRAAQAEELDLELSAEGVDMIIYYEVGGRSYYESRLQRPTWPGGASGVTVGFGYDVGYNTRSRIAVDWAGVASQSEIAALQSVAGLRGSRAKYALAKVRTRVSITFAEAQRVFERQTLPRFTALTAQAFQLRGPQRLHPHGNAALVSLVFNRGSQVDYSSRRREMAWIRYNLGVRKDERVPGDIRAMKRLWVGRGLDGLLKRRDAEAVMFERGLAARG